MNTQKKEKKKLYLSIIGLFQITIQFSSNNYQRIRIKTDSIYLIIIIKKKNTMNMFQLAKI